MEKKNNISLLILIFCVLSMIIGLLGGYILSDKFLGTEKSTTENQDSQNQNDNKDANKESISMDDVKKIMESYKLSDFCGHYYLTSLSNAAALKQVVINSTEVSGNINCSELSNTNIYKELGLSSDTCSNNNINYYSYDSVKAVAQKLFGDNFDAIKLKNNDVSSCDCQFFYIFEINSFVPIELGCGGDCNATSELTIDSYEVIENQLKIRTTRMIFDDNKSITSKYEYLFEKVNDNYYLSKIDLLNA